MSLEIVSCWASVASEIVVATVFVCTLKRESLLLLLLVFCCSSRSMTPITESLRHITDICFQLVSLLFRIPRICCSSGVVSFCLSKREYTKYIYRLCQIIKYTVNAGIHCVQSYGLREQERKLRERKKKNNDCGNMTGRETESRERVGTGLTNCSRAWLC